jgi:palmitoyltransferase
MVCILILFVTYTSQYLFYFIDPGPLSEEQALWFNVFVLVIWWCYDRACTVDPARRGWVRKVVPGAEGSDDEDDIILDRG